jgi:hypothetical protein
VVLPKLDDYFRDDVKNPSKEESKYINHTNNRKMERDLSYKFPLYLAVFADWVMMFLVIHHVVNERPGIIEVTNISN